MARHLSVFFFSTLLLSALSLALITGCKPQEGDLNQISETLQESIDLAVKEALSTVDGLRPQDLAHDEFTKLRAFEYHVESIPLPTTAKDLQLRLQDLGNNRWDCGVPVVGLTAPANPQEATGTFALMNCRRRPESYLRLLKGDIQ